MQSDSSVIRALSPSRGNWSGISSTSWSSSNQTRNMNPTLSSPAWRSPLSSQHTRWHSTRFEQIGFAREKEMKTTLETPTSTDRHSNIRSSLQHPFAMLGSNRASTPSRPVAEKDESASKALPTLFMRFIWGVIASCFIVHYCGLLLLFTPIYRKSVHPFIASYMHFALPPVLPKESSTTLVYVLVIGVVPTSLASILWCIFRRNATLHIPWKLDTIWTKLYQKPLIRVPSWDSELRTFVWRAKYFDMSVADIVLMTLFLASNVFIFIQVLEIKVLTVSAPSATFSIRNVGKASGHACIFSMVWMLLSACRRSFWQEFFHQSTSHSSCSQYHNWIVMVVFVLATLHVLCHLLVIQLGQESVSKLMSGFSSMLRKQSVEDANPAIIAYGELAFCALLFLAFTMYCTRYQFYRRCCLLGVKKTRQHESPAMTLLRRFLATFGLFLLCVHYPPTIVWMTPPLVLYVNSAFIRLRHVTPPTTVLEMTPLSKHDPTQPRRVFRVVLQKADSNSDDYMVGQYVYLNFPKLSSLHWHPAAVARTSTRQAGVMTCYVRSDEQHLTSSFHELYRFSETTEAPPVVHVDGIYGPLHSVYFEQYRCMVLVAHDLTVTRVFSVLEEAYDRCVARTENTTDFGPQTAAHGKQVWFIWTTSDMALLQEFEPLFARIRVLDPEEQFFKLRLFFTGETAEPSSATTRQRSNMNGLSADSIDGAQSEGRLRSARQNSGGNENLPYRTSVSTSNEDCLHIRSQPFRQALDTPLLQGLSVVSSLFIAAAILLYAVWNEVHYHDFVIKKNESDILGSDDSSDGTFNEGTFDPIKRFITPVAVCLGCLIVGVFLLLEDCIQRFKETDPSKTTHGPTVDNQCTAGDTRQRRHLNESLVLARLNHRPSHAILEEIRATLGFGGKKMSPADILSYYNVTLAEPDYITLFTAIGRSIPRALGPIGLFAAGGRTFLHQTEMAAIQASKDDRHAIFRFKQMDF